MRGRRSDRWAIDRLVASLVTLLAACGLSLPVPAFAQTFQVDKVSVCSNRVTDWSSPCSEVGPPFQVLDRKVFVDSNVYVKVSVTCADRALSVLRENYTFPIYATVWKDGTKKPDIFIGIAESDWSKNASAWINMVSSQAGSFHWVTFFSVGLFDFKTIEFQIVDAQKNVAYVNGAPARVTLKFAN